MFSGKILSAAEKIRAKYDNPDDKKDKIYNFTKIISPIFLPHLSHYVAGNDNPNSPDNLDNPSVRMTSLMDIAHVIFTLMITLTTLIALITLS